MRSPRWAQSGRFYAIDAVAYQVSQISALFGSKIVLSPPVLSVWPDIFTKRPDASADNRQLN
jgi:hypothetical protein